MVKIICLFFTSLIISNTLYAAVIATVDRSDIAINESFTLRYESSNEEKRTPDFSPINQDFDIVGQNRASNISIINGKSSRKTIFNLDLIAKRTGKLTIPEIQFSQATSASIVINVKEETQSSTDKDIHLTLSVDKKNAYVQEQIVVAVKLARAINAQQENISDLAFSHEDIILEPLSDDYKQYEAMLNGRRYIVFEKQYALFSQKSGELHLSPLTYNAVIYDQQSRRGGFFDDPFFNRGSGQRIRENSQAISLSIKAKPDNFIGKHWLPAKNVEVNTAFSNKDAIKVGDSITRTVTISANQQLASTLPVMTLDTIAQAKIYPDQAESSQHKLHDSIVSQRIERTAIVPTQAGELLFPEQRLEWWNTDNQQKETIIIPAERIVVQALSNNTLDTPKTNNALGNTSDKQSASIWFYIALLAITAWLCTVAAWLYLTLKQRKISRPVSADKQAIIKACKNHDAKDAQATLLAWAQQTWPNREINSLASLSNIAGSDGLSQAINALQHHLYGKAETHWNGKALQTCIENFAYAQPVIPKKNAAYGLYKIN